MSTRPAVIVKLGGSYAGSPLLRPWLLAVEAAAGRVVLVPGGGPFADAVRAMQPVMGFDDEAADAMAMLAMAQFGQALCSLGRLLVPAESAEEIEAALDGGRVPVWSPLPIVRRESGLPASWDVTSDSLALWLARRLEAAALLLVKRRDAGPPSPSCPDLIRPSTTSPGRPQAVDARIKSGHDDGRKDVSYFAALSRDGVVDAFFPHLHLTYPCQVFLAAPGDVPPDGLDPDRLPGARLAGGWAAPGVGSCLSASCS